MITIVIAEDQEMLLGVIGSLLNLEEDMEVVGKARNVEEALYLVDELQPDVCIIDIDMPTMNGLDAAQALKLTGCKVIMLTTFAKTEYFERAIKAGVRGYLLKDSPSKELVYSIRSIMDGKQIYSPELIDDKSSYNERLVDVFITNEPLIKKSKIMGTVKNYFSIIIDKMKLPTC